MRNDQLTRVNLSFKLLHHRLVAQRLLRLLKDKASLGCVVLGWVELHDWPVETQHGYKLLDFGSVGLLLRGDVKIFVVDFMSLRHHRFDLVEVTNLHRPSVWLPQVNVAG